MKLPRLLWLELCAYFVIFLMCLLTSLSSKSDPLLLTLDEFGANQYEWESTCANINTQLSNISSNEVLKFKDCIYSPGAAINISQLMSLSNTTILLDGGTVEAEGEFVIEFPSMDPPEMKKLQITLMNMNFHHATLEVIGSLPPQSSLTISNNTFREFYTSTNSILGLILVGDSSSLLLQGSSLVIENNSVTKISLTINVTVAFVWLRYSYLQLGANSNILISGNILHDVALTNAKLYVVYWSPLATAHNVELTIADSSEVVLQGNAMSNVNSSSAAVVFIFSAADISLVVSGRSRLSMSNNEALDIIGNEGVSVVGVYSTRSVIVTTTNTSVLSFRHNVVDGALSKDISAFYLNADVNLSLIANLTSSIAFVGNTITSSPDGYQLSDIAVVQAVYLMASQFLTILVSNSSSVSALQNLVSNATDNSHTYSVRWQASSVVNITAMHGSSLAINNNTVRDVSRVDNIVSASISSSLLSINLINKSYFGLSYNMVTNAVAIGNASAVRLTGEQQVKFILSASSNVSMNSNSLLNTQADFQTACVRVLGSGTGLSVDVSAASSWNVVANTVLSSNATHGDVSALNCSATSIIISLRNSVANLSNNAIESSSGYSLRTVWWNAASILVAQLSRSSLCVKNNAILGSSYSLNISCAVMWRSESSSRIAISSASNLTVFGNAIFNIASTTLLSTVLLSTLQLNVSNSSTATFSGNTAKNSAGVSVCAILLSFCQLHVANDAAMSLNDNYLSNISASDNVTVVSLNAIAGGAMNMGIANRSVLCMSRNAMKFVAAASRLVNVLIDVSGSASKFNVSSGSSVIISSNSIVSSSGLPSAGGLKMSVVVVNYFNFTVSNSYISISNLTVADISLATTLVGYGIYGGALSLSASSMTISGISIQGNQATTAIRACYYSVVSLTATNSLLSFSRIETAMTGNGQTNTSIAFVTILSSSVVLEEVASLDIRDNRQTLSTVADLSLIRIKYPNSDSTVIVFIGLNCSISVTNNSLDTIYSGDNTQSILSLVVHFVSSPVNSACSVTIRGNNISLTGRFLSSEIIEIRLQPSAWFILVTGNIINVVSKGVFCPAALSITSDQSEQQSQLTVTRNEIAIAVSESGAGGCLLLKLPPVTDRTSIDIRDNEFLIVNSSTSSTFITIPYIQGSGSLFVVGNRFESLPSDSVIVHFGSQSQNGHLLIENNYILLPSKASLLLVQYTNVVAFSDSEQYDIEACGNRLNGHLIVRPDWYMNDHLDSVYPCSRTLSPLQPLTASTTMSPSNSHTSSSTQSRSNNITTKSSTNSVSLSRPTESLSLMSSMHSVTTTVSTALPTEDEVVFIPVGVPAPTTAILTVTASALGGVTTAVDAQTIAVISMVSCATKDGKRSSKDKDKNEMRSISIVTLDNTCEGLLLGNIIAVLAAAFLTAVMVAVAMIILNNRFIAQKRQRSVAASEAFSAPIVQPTLVNASAMVRAPQLLVMICVYMMNSFAVCGLRLARDDDAASVTKLGGAVAFVFPLVLVFGFPLVTYLFGTRQLLLVQYSWKPKVVSLLGSFILQSWALDPSIESDKMYGGVFGAYRRLQPQWSLVSQVSFISSLPAMLATTSSGSCGPLFIISSAMYFMGSITVLVFRPRRVFLVDLLHSITLFVNGLIVAAAVWLVDHPPIRGAAESNLLEHLGTAITVLSVIRVSHSAASTVVNVLISREVLGGVEYVLPNRKEALLSDIDDDLDVLLLLPDDQHSPLEIERLNSVDRHIQTSSAWNGKTKSHAQSNSILPKTLSQFLLISEMSYTGKWWPMPTRADRPPNRSAPTAVLGDILDDILGDPTVPHTALLTHDSTSLPSGQSLEIKELSQQLEPERPLVSILNANTYLRSSTNEDLNADESLFLSEDEKFRRQIARECVQRQIFETHISDKSKK